MKKLRIIWIRFSKDFGKKFLHTFLFLSLLYAWIGIPIFAIATMNSY